MGLGVIFTLPPVFSVTNCRAGQQISIPPIAFVRSSLLMRFSSSKLEPWPA